MGIEGFEAQSADGMPYMSTATRMLTPRIFFPPSSHAQTDLPHAAGSTVDNHGAGPGRIPAGARQCMPQKQTHQIAMTALHGAAPARGGFGPDRSGRAPAFVMASSSASTSSTDPSISAKAFADLGDMFAGRTAVPMFWS